MDNKNTGKLIANLRKKKGLTQQQLGDKIGVGFRAVSKWERGHNLPDIGNMNELSKILGITLDELLAGKLKEETNVKDKKKIPTKIKITISIITAIILIFILSFIYTYNKIYVYNIVSADEAQYVIEGKVTFQENEMSIIINRLKFIDYNLKETKIKNYEYNLISNDIYLFRYGYTSELTMTENDLTINEALEKLRVNYTGKAKLPRKEILDNHIELEITFVDENNELIKKTIEIILYQSEEKNNYKAL